jgi:hypothetical protein
MKHFAAEGSFRYLKYDESLATDEDLEYYEEIRDYDRLGFDENAIIAVIKCFLSIAYSAADACFLCYRAPGETRICISEYKRYS